MRVIVQRVKEASCTIANKLYSNIGKGYLLLVGIGLEDDETIVKKMALKISKLRIFEDEAGKMNLDLKQVGGSLLSISQFTLYADCHKGNRPSFALARKGQEASDLYDYFNQCLREEGFEVKTGSFGAEMQIALINDGPVTISLEVNDG